MEIQLAIANIFFSSKDADFLHVDEHQSFLQVDFNTLNIKFFYKVILPLSMGMMKQFHSTQSNNLQYLYNISRKAVRNRVCFFLHADKHHIPTKSHALCVRHTSQHFFSYAYMHNKYYLRHELLSGF